MIVVLTGDRNAGKTTVVAKTVAELRARGISVAGFYAPDSDEGKDLVAASTGERIPFARQGEPGPAEVGVGRFAISQEALETGIEWAAQPSDVLVADEIGRLERDGGGFAPVIENCKPNPDRGILLSVRREVVPDVLADVPAETPSRQFVVTDENRDRLPQELSALLVDDVEQG